MVGYRLPRVVYPLSLIGTLAGGAVLIREYVGGKSYRGQESMIGKTVIITGANSGIGKATATELARKGARVILACRDLEKATKARAEIVVETANRNVDVRQLDLASLDSIKRFAQDVSNGHFYLTNLLLGKLISSQPSRVVTLASIAHQRGFIDFADLNSVHQYESARAYNQSKLANVMFTRELAKRLEGTGVRTYAVHPGIVKTEIGRHMSIAKSSFSSIFLGPFIWLFTKSPRQGAQTVLYCACSEEVANESGKYYYECDAAEPSEAAKDDAACRRLWAISEKWTRLT